MAIVKYGTIEYFKGQFLQCTFWSLPSTNSNPTGSRRLAPAAWCPQEKNKKEKKKKEKPPPF